MPREKACLSSGRVHCKPPDCLERGSCASEPLKFMDPSGWIHTPAHRPPAHGVVQGMTLVSFVGKQDADCGLA